MSDTSLKEPIQDIPFRDLRPSARLIGNYGILFLLWGWAGLLKFILDYIEEYTFISISLRQGVEILGYIVIAFWMAGTIYFLYRHSAMKLTYFGYILRIVWISMILSMVIFNVIQINVLNNINFEFQHPVFMTFYAFATVISGGILKQKMLLMGGIILAISAIVSSYLELNDQLALEAVAWIAAFIIPGHIMYAKGGREKSIHLYQ